jgi:hypothetical protein
MPETMAGIRGVLKPILYNLLLSFTEYMNLSIVPGLIFFNSIVFVYRNNRKRNTLQKK